MKFGAETYQKYKEINDLGIDDDEKRNLLELLAVADLAVGSTDQLNVVVSEGKNYSAVPADRFYRHLDIGESTIDALFNADGSLKRTESPDKILNGIEDPPELFLEWLYQFCRPFYEPIQAVLDETGHNPEIGFNNHELDKHIIFLINLLSYILRENKMNPREINLLLVAIFMHDMGNAFNRFAHPEISDLMQLRIFGSDISQIEEFSAYRSAIHYHDEKISTRIISSMVNEVKDRNNLTELQKSKVFLAMYKSKFSMIDSLMRLVDKLHFGRGRVLNTRGLSAESIKDSHIVVNSLFHLDGEKLSDHIKVTEDEYGRRSLKIVATFTLTPDEKFIHHTSGIVVSKNRTGAQELRVPPQMRKDFKEKGVVYLASTFKTFVELYSERMVLMALDSFRINPTLSEVTFEFIDPRKEFVDKNGNNVRVNPYIITLNRESILDQVQIMKRANPKSEKPINPMNLRMLLEAAHELAFENINSN